MRRIAQREESSQAFAVAQEAFSELFRRHSTALARFLAARLPQEEADLSQELWLTVWRKAAQFARADSFRGWLFQMARNRLVDSHRRKRPGSLADGALEGHADRSGEWTAIAEEYLERQHVLQKCVGRMREDLRLLVQQLMQGREYQDIASGMGVPTSLLHRRFHAAKDFLKKCVQGE